VPQYFRIFHKITVIHFLLKVIRYAAAPIPAA